MRCPSDPSSSQFIKRKRTGLTADQSLSADLQNVRLAPDPTNAEEELKFENVVVTAKSDDPVTANSLHYQHSSNHGSPCTGHLVPEHAMAVYTCHGCVMNADQVVSIGLIPTFFMPF